MIMVKMLLAFDYPLEQRKAKCVLDKMGNVFSDSCAAKVAPAPISNSTTPANAIIVNKPTNSPSNKPVNNSTNKPVNNSPKNTTNTNKPVNTIKSAEQSQTGGKRRKTRSSKKVSKK